MEKINFKHYLLDPDGTEKFVFNDGIGVGTPFEYIVIGVNETNSTYEIVDDAYFSHVPFIIKYSNYFIL